jgi:cell division protein FtsL
MNLCLPHGWRSRSSLDKKRNRLTWVDGAFLAVVVVVVVVVVGVIVVLVSLV